MTTAQSLKRVGAAAARAASARVKFENEIRAARANGASLRAIAGAAGLSVERVRQITTRKSPREMTSDEAVKELFPPEVVAEAKRVANQSTKKGRTS